MKAVDYVDNLIKKKELLWKKKKQEMVSDLNVRMWPYRMSHGTSILKNQENKY
jgi:hypothetical protein